MEAKTNVVGTPAKWTVVNREFFTFRAFAWHYILIVPHQLKEFLLSFQIAMNTALMQNPYYYQRGAIGIDNNTGGSFSHTCTGSNLVLGVGIGIYAASVSVTYAAAAMTQQQLNTRDNLDGFTLRSYLFYKASPATGANNVTTTNATPEQTTGYGAGYAISFSGADTASPIDISGGSNGSDTAPTVSVTTTQNNSYAIDCVITDNNAGMTATVGAGQTSIVNMEVANGMKILGSYEQKVTAGSVTLDWSLSASRKWALSVMAIKELAVAATGKFFQMF